MRYATEVWNAGDTKSEWVEFAADGAIHRVAIAVCVQMYEQAAPSIGPSWAIAASASLQREVPRSLPPKMAEGVPVPANLMPRFTVVDKPEVLAALVLAPPFWMLSANDQIIVDLPEPVAVKRGEKLFLHLDLGQVSAQYSINATALMHVYTRES